MSRSLKNTRTSCNDIIHHNHLLARLDGIGLHLEEVLAILLVVALGLAGARELALLAHGDEAGAKSQGQTRAEEETTGLKTDDNVGLLISMDLKDVKLQAAKESLMQRGVGEDGQDIFEEDSGRREVRELAQSRAQFYFKTGEFGGAGGMGGGLSGDLGGGIGSLSGLAGGGLGHDEGGRRREEKKRRRKERKGK